MVAVRTRVTSAGLKNFARKTPFHEPSYHDTNRSNAMGISVIDYSVRIIGAGG
jgi:hypothetical protein